MPRRINADGLKLIKQWEGLILFAYDDFDDPKRRRKIQPGDTVHGTLTIGYGSTGPHVRPGMTITEGGATQLLLEDLSRFEAGVERLVKVPLNDNQFAALVAFAFNIGLGTVGDPKRKGFVNTTLLKKLNAGDYAAVPGELMKFVTSKGKRLAGLVNRRSAEAGLWSRGAFVASNTVAVDVVAPKPISKSATGNTAIGIGATGVLVAAGQAQEGAKAARDISDSIGVPIGVLLGLALVAGAGFIWWRRWTEVKEQAS